MATEARNAATTSRSCAWGILLGPEAAVTLHRVEDSAKALAPREWQTKMWYPSALAGSGDRPGRESERGGRSVLRASGLTALAVVWPWLWRPAATKRPSWPRRPSRKQAALERGVAAYKGGDFQTALTVLRPLADAGNPAAQNDVGRMYYDGKGVPREQRRSGEVVSAGRRERPARRAVQSRRRLRIRGRCAARTSSRPLIGTGSRPTRVTPKRRSISAGCTMSGRAWRRTRSRRSVSSTWPLREAYPKRSTISACCTAPAAVRRRTMPRR